MCRREFDTDDFSSSIVPNATILRIGKAAQDAYGHRYGSQILNLTLEQLTALQKGGQVAVDIMDGEYVLFLCGPQQSV